MTGLQTSLRGLWLPLITPFRDGELDEPSLRRLVRHYAALAVDGLILAATTGESLTLEPQETERLVATVREEAGRTRNLPICLGLSGSNTAALLRMLERTAAWPIDLYLISCPYYSRPSQHGMIRHFSALADRAAHPVMIYNIPYRTGVNLGNDAMLQLADHRNIVGLKDCGAIREQSLDLLRRRPAGFAVLTGEDAHYHEALADGADGGILASAHVETGIFADVWRLLAAGQRDAAMAGGGGADAVAVRRTEPGADQVLAVAHRIDRQRRSAVADDGGQRRTGGADGRGDRAEICRCCSSTSPVGRGKTNPAAFSLASTHSRSR
jgi:4-hydroxy-tetrahydrodipicolinate synthase